MHASLLYHLQKIMFILSLAIPVALASVDFATSLSDTWTAFTLFLLLICGK